MQADRRPFLGAFLREGGKEDLGLFQLNPRSSGFGKPLWLYSITFNSTAASCEEDRHPQVLDSFWESSKYLPV